MSAVAESGGVERIIKALHNFGHAHEYEREGYCLALHNSHESEACSDSMWENKGVLR